VRARRRRQVSRSEAQWKAWYETEAPEDEPIPDGYDSWMSAFDRLLLVRCWCPHRTTHEAHKYIHDRLGSEYVAEHELDLANMALENDCRSPLIGLISAGSGPTNSIEAAAKKLKIGEPKSSFEVSFVIFAARLQQNKALLY